MRRRLTEGGNAFDKVNSTIPRESYKKMVELTLKATNLKGIKTSPVGNIQKPYLGDIDLAVDGKTIADAIGYKGNDAKEFWQAVKTHLSKSKVMDFKLQPGLKQFNIIIPLVDKNGKQLPAHTDREGTIDKTQKGYVQVDFMIGDMKWMAQILSGAPDSKYKAVYRNLLLVDIFSNLVFKTNNPEVKRKFQVDFKNGIELVNFKIDEKGKKQKLSSSLKINNMNKVAAFLFGTSVKWKDIDTYEKLLKHLNSSKFHFPKNRAGIMNNFKTTLGRMKLDMPKK